MELLLKLAKIIIDDNSQLVPLDGKKKCLRIKLTRVELKVCVEKTLKPEKMFVFVVHFVILTPVRARFSLESLS